MSIHHHTPAATPAGVVAALVDRSMVRRMGDRFAAIEDAAGAAGGRVGPGGGGGAVIW